MHTFLKYDLEFYLKGRRNDSRKEEPLVSCQSGQDHIHYRKGAIAFYTLREYLGEENLNQILADFLKESAKSYPPYPTSEDLILRLRQQTPDSLQYLISDLFERITFHEVALIEATVLNTRQDSFEVELTIEISKYHLNQQSKRQYESDFEESLILPKIDGDSIQSMFLNDLIEIALFKEQKQVYLGCHELDAIRNTVEINVSERPTKAVVDPYFKLIEMEKDDNKKEISIER